MANKDTENKRRGAFLYALPKPDGTVGQADRQHKAWKYPGVLSTASTSIVEINVPAADHYQPGVQMADHYQPGNQAADQYEPGTQIGDVWP